MGYDRENQCQIFMIEMFIPLTRAYHLLDYVTKYSGFEPSHIQREHSLLLTLGPPSLSQDLFKTTPLVFFGNLYFGCGSIVHFLF